jgi:D-lyxose ketol-isomerase
MQKAMSMITKKEFKEAQRKALKLFREAGIVLTLEEKKKIEVTDFGLGNLTRVGLEIVTYVNTDRYCAKELALFPGQTCPEHLHPNIEKELGKKETFRCRWGAVYLYVPGQRTTRMHSVLPSGREKYYTVYHELVLKSGRQYTILPNTLHWFQAGNRGAVISEFSSKSQDEKDVFTDPSVLRIAKVI